MKKRIELIEKRLLRFEVGKPKWKKSPQGQGYLNKTLKMISSLGTTMVVEKLIELHNKINNV